MAENDRETLVVQFPKLQAVLPLLEEQDANQAVMLLSEDASGVVGAETLARLLCEEPIILRGEQLRKAEWREQTDWIRQTGQQMDMFIPPRKGRLCLVITRLDEAPAWAIDSLKSLLENSKRPFACIASATDEKRMPTYLTSHFHRVRKAKRIRKPKDDGDAS